jgi:hypothetical protein
VKSVATEGIVPDDLIARLGAADIGPTVLPDGSGVILDMSGHQVVSLSKTGAVLVKELQSGTHGIDDLAAALVRRFDVEPDEARRDTVKFLDSLHEALVAKG